MNKTKTAVEYLLEQMGLEQLIFPKNIIDKALEMEKQQIEKDYSLSCTFDSCIETKDGCRCGKQYYEKTYKSK
jgi:hypothetical protein